MPRNGTGGYTQPVSDFASGTLIRSADVNSWLDDLGSEVTNSLAKDGQTTPTANLPMGGFKHTNAADATVAGQYATFGQVGLVKFADTAITAVAAIDVTWTAGTYTAVHIFLVNYAGSSTLSTTEALLSRFRSGGTYISTANYITWGSEQVNGTILHFSVGSQTEAPLTGSGQLGALDRNDTELSIFPGGASPEATNSQSRTTGIGSASGGGTNVVAIRSNRLDAQAAAVDGVRLFWASGGNFQARGRIVALGLRA